MFDGGAVFVGGEAVTGDRDEVWTELHRALKKLGVRRAMLDARELDLLREAEEIGLVRRRGHATMAAYMVAELECSRHTANEKLRVAMELIDLPEIAARSREGEIGWTAVREITRVATEATEEEWLAACEGKSATEVQQMVKGFRKGEAPSAKPDPEIVEDWIGLSVPPAVFAMWRQMRAALDADAGTRLSDAQVAERLCKLATAEGGTGPGFQIAITTCRQCKAAAQVGPGVENAISPAALERAQCDAELVGDLEVESAERTQRTIPANSGARSRVATCSPAAFRDAARSGFSRCTTSCTASTAVRTHCGTCSSRAMGTTSRITRD